MINLNYPNNTENFFENESVTHSQSNVLDVTSHLKKRGNINQTTSTDAISGESILIAKDYPLKIDLPIYVDKGYKVTIRVLKEEINTSNTVTEIPTKSRGFEINENQTNSIQKKDVDNNFGTSSLNNDKIILDEENKENDLMTQQKDYFINILTKVQNYAIGMCVSVAIIFLFLTIGGVISKYDFLFVLLMTSLFGFVMFFDKFYRRNMNNG